MYRLINFPLSHCVHSAISDVWIIEQFQAHTINDHLANGRPWDLDRTYGGLRVLQPQTGTPGSGWHQGNADAIYRNRRFIREFAPDIIMVLSADHIYKLDYRAVIAAHRDHDAVVTMDLLAPEPPIDLDEPGWPIRTMGSQRTPAHIFGTASVDNSLISAGCVIHGSVERSVLGPGVLVAAGARVSNAVILDNTTISADATVAYAIVDSHVQVGARATIGGEAIDEQGQPLLSLVGYGAQIADRVSIPPGARVPAAKQT